MTRALKPGDVVRLKSGGPKMTIDMLPVEGFKSASCVWFEGTVCNKAFIQPESLVRVRRRQPAAPAPTAPVEPPVPQIGDRCRFTAPGAPPVVGIFAGVHPIKLELRARTDSGDLMIFPRAGTIIEPAPAEPYKPKVGDRVRFRTSEDRRPDEWATGTVADLGGRDGSFGTYLCVVKRDDGQGAAGDGWYLYDKYHVAIELIEAAPAEQ